MVVGFELTSFAVMEFSGQMLKCGGLLLIPLLSYIKVLPFLLAQLKNDLLSVHSSRVFPGPF